MAKVVARTRSGHDPALPGCRLIRVARDGPAALTVVAEAQRDHARCPNCRTLSVSVHSRYQRRAADLPAGGKVVRLQLTVRRFYCRNPACPRRTFAADAVTWIESHNATGALPRIEMWPESHLERLLAGRPAMIAEFGLRG